MKTIVKLLPTLLAFSMFMACNSGQESKKETRTDKKLGKMEVEIPESIKGNQELVDYINSMADVTDAYALMIDQIMEEAHDLIGIPEEELSMAQRMRLLKVASKAAIESSTIMAKWAEYETLRLDMEEQLTDEEIEALGVVWQNFEARMQQIDEKYNGALLNNDV